MSPRIELILEDELTKAIMVRKMIKQELKPMIVNEKEIGLFRGSGEDFNKFIKKKLENQKEVFVIGEGVKDGKDILLATCYTKEKIYQKMASVNL